MEAMPRKEVKISMPYENERSSGDSLIWLENSRALDEFKNTLLVKEGGCTHSPASTFGEPAELASKESYCHRRF